ADLIVYDLSPSDMLYKPAQGSTWPGCAKVPFVFGFALAPSSASPAAMACPDKVPPPTMAQPASQPTIESEVLIGTSFYDVFQVSGDCQCGKTLLTPQMTWPANTPMTGIVEFDGYRYFAPTVASVLTMP